jgi:hypothetical protein
MLATSRRRPVRSAALALALPLAALLGAASAWADDDDRDATAQELLQVRNALESKGYSEVHDLEVEDCRYEVDAKNAAGKKVELELDLKTLAILDEDD